MTEISHVWQRVSRRSLLRGAALTGAGLAGAALIGCGGTSKAPAGGGGGGESNAKAGAATIDKSNPFAPVVKGTKKPGGTWAQPITATSSIQDMHVTASSMWQTISEGALNPHPVTGEPQASVIEKWEIPDSTHFVFHVRNGVKIHNKAPWNGRDFTAEDLAFNIDRIVGNTAQAEGIPKAQFQRADTLAGISKVEVTDKSTVKVTMSRPNPAFILGFLDHRNMMMPKGVVEVGFKDPMKLAGISAWQMTEFVPGVREVYQKFDGYFRQGEPNFEKRVYTVTADRGADVAGFISKQFTVFTDGNDRDVKTIQAARPDALLYSSLGISWHHFRPNLKYGAFSDFRVRKALMLATDYKEIGDGYYGPGWGWVAGLHSFFPESWNQEKVQTLPGYNQSTKAKDREEAAKLLAASGHQNGEGIAFEQLTSPGWSFSEATKENALRFQSQMTKLFPAMKITNREAADFATFAKAQTDKNFQAVSYAIGSQRDISSDAFALYHSKGVRNYGSFSSPEADALIEKAQVEFDVNARRDIYNTFLTKFHNEWLPLITFNLYPTRTMVQPDVSGYEKMMGPWSSGLTLARSGSLYFVA